MGTSTTRLAITVEMVDGDAEIDWIFRETHA